jgi:hypothetical protein
MSNDLAHTLTLICLIAAVALFALHAVGATFRSVSLVWLGVAFLVAGVYLVPAF